MTPMYFKFGKESIVFLSTGLNLQSKQSVFFRSFVLGLEEKITFCTREFNCFKVEGDSSLFSKPVTSTFPNFTGKL